MKKEEPQFTLSDLIDILLWLGGFGFPLVILPQVVPIQGFMLLAGSLFLGGLGLARFVGRKKQRKIDELERLIDRHLPELLEQPDNRIARIASRQALPQTTDELEVKFLEALILQKGRITLTEAAVLTHISIDKLMKIVERLQHKGIIGAEVSDSGQIIYVNMA